MKLNLNNFACLLAALIPLSCATKKAEDNAAQDSVAAAPAPETKPSARPVHWGYSGDVDPSHWGSLTPVYAACGEGKNQSPIDIISKSESGSPNLSLDYKTSSLKIAHHEHVDDILDNGHTIQVTVEEGSSFTLNDRTYNLKQFHFHTPSEHTVDGKHFPLEMHWVHQSSDGSFGVIGLLFEEGKANDNFAKIIEHMPSLPGESTHFTDVKLDLNVHVPKNISAYHYIGSFTTPPCTENVEWLILRNKFTLSKGQIEAFSSRLKNNNRPVQAMNGRKLTIDQIQ
ncbi:MAG TPA: carbonic anhydrase family protein [Chryseolinea sp.]